MANRRNLYRLLHVQHDAPTAVIRASFRTLMQSLKMHPDLGGNIETAQLINEAYEVLTNPAKRNAYDYTLRQQQHPMVKPQKRLSEQSASAWRKFSPPSF